MSGFLIDDTQAVLFDLDGTLLDHDAARDAGVAAMVRREREVEETEVENLLHSWHQISDALYERYLDGEFSFEQQRLLRVQEFAESAQVDASTEEKARELFGVYQQEYQRQWRAFDDVAPAIERLRNSQVSIAIVTNGPDRQQRLKVQQIGLGEFPVIASGNYPFSKPDVRIFMAGCQAVSADPKKCLMVGDNPRADVIGAQEAGLGGVLLDRQETIRVQFPQLPVITTLDELF